MPAILRGLICAALYLPLPVFAALYQFTLSGKAQVSLAGAATQLTQLSFTGLGDPATSAISGGDWGIAPVRIDLFNNQIITPSFTVTPRIVAGGDTELIHWLSITGGTALTLLPDTSFIGLEQQLPVDWLGTIDPEFFRNANRLGFSWAPNPNPASVLISVPLSSFPHQITLSDGRALNYSWMGSGTFAAAPIPEPGTLDLVLLGLVAVVARLGDRSTSTLDGPRF
jgi:hypothetical protein